MIGIILKMIHHNIGPNRTRFEVNSAAASWGRSATAVSLRDDHYDYTLSGLSPSVLHSSREGLNSRCILIMST